MNLVYFSSSVKTKLYSVDKCCMPGLCLLDIGSSPYIGHEIIGLKAYFNMPLKAYFHIFLPQKGDALNLVRELPGSRL